MKQASNCGRSKQNTWSLVHTPPMTPIHDAVIGYFGVCNF
jgi:hypothetical protein